MLGPVTWANSPVADARRNLLNSSPQMADVGVPPSSPVLSIGQDDDFEYFNLELRSMEFWDGDDWGLAIGFDASFLVG